MRKRSAPWLGLLAAAGLLLTAACKKRETPVDLGNRHQVLFWGNGAEPQDIDPQIVTGVPEHNIIAALFEGLVNEDPHDLHPIPGVAESWDLSPDGKVYTFHLRADAKWSNGDPVTAGDFVQSYKRILTPSLASQYAYMLYYVVGAEAYNTGKLADFSRVGFAAPDARTLRITLNHPVPYFLKLLNHYSWYPVPVKVIAKFDGLTRPGTAWTNPKSFVGNGPFNLVRWDPQDVLVVKKSPTYWNRAIVKLNEIRFYPVESDGVEERMFRSGQLHYTSTIPLAKIAVYRRDHPDELHLDPYLGVYFYRLNVTKPPLTDVRVRRALALAIDREDLVKYVTRGGEAPAYEFCPPMPADGYVARARLSGNVAEARRLLAEAGYPDGRGFPHVELLYNTLEAHRVIAEAIQQMWKRNLNISITLTNEEWKVYLDSQRTLNYQISRSGWIADYEDPHTFYEIFTTGGGNNQTGWGNPEYDRLLARAIQSQTQAERYACYQRMEQILVDEVPIIPIYFYTSKHLYLPNVQGIYPTLLDHHPYQYIWLENKP